MAAKEKLGKHVLDLRVSLRGISPEIWRLVSVSADATLTDLHRTIQGAFRWEDAHPHEFEIGGTRYAEGEDSRTPLRRILHLGDRALYRYDVNDAWEHEIDVVRMYEVPTRRYHPKVLDGARNGPPEDVGGRAGYEAYARTADPRALEAFDAQLATRRVHEFAHREKPAKARPARKPMRALPVLVELMQLTPGVVDANEQAVLGFFAGLFSGPLILPSAWLPYIFGDLDEHAWQSEAEAQAAVGVAVDAYNDVGTSVLDRTYDGMLFDRAWARGFMAAVAAGGDRWKDALRNDDLKVLAAPIILSGAPNAKIEPDPQRLRDAIARLMSWWRAHPTKASPNDPCPCGSGKKYKRCCSPLRAV